MEILEIKNTLAVVLMPAGTLSFGHYWEDRPYNVFHWQLPDGTTEAYYFNLADRTCLREGEAEWRDLVVDVMATPDGQVRVLDEDELLADLDPALRAGIEATVAHLLAQHGAIAAEVATASARCRGSLPPESTLPGAG
ncbi:MAG: DUF402 domain-containing protein [Chloroflexi bacterium]|nr:DUF402 domain-containing protein [Chloroflexota bacterium]MCL5109505.1 DUF402 domain-containing protein [Chloroflexota bacterium]